MDQPSTSDADEPLRSSIPPETDTNAPGVPPGYVYDPEMDAYVAPGTMRFWVPPKPITRPPDVPPEAVWDPELHAWLAPGEPKCDDWVAWQRDFDKLREELRREPPIPKEQLRVPPGTLDVPPEWRKSLRAMPDGKRERQRDLFSGLSDDDDPTPVEQPLMPHEPDCRESADEAES